MASSSQPVIWKSHPILVSMGADRDPHDILQLLSDTSDPYNRLQRERGNFHFPVDLYPPDWEKRNVIVDAIINAARKVDVFLVKAQTRPHKKGSDSKIHPRVKLLCNEGFYYRNRETTKMQVSSVPDQESSTVSERKEATDQKEATDRKVGIRIEGLVRKHHDRAIIRPSRTLQNRTSSLKQPKGCTCQHSIILLLHPNMFWYIKPGTGNSWHNHVHRPPGETRPRKAELSKEEQDKVASLARHGGCAAAVAVLHETTNRTFSRSQLKRMRDIDNVERGYVLARVYPLLKVVAESHVMLLISSDTWRKSKRLGKEFCGSVSSCRGVHTSNCAKS